MIFPWKTIWIDEPPIARPPGLGPLMVRLVLPKDGVRRSPRETETPRQEIPSAGSATSNPDRARTAQSVSRNQGRTAKRQQDTMERGRSSAGRQQGQMVKRRKKGRWKGILLLLLVALIGYGAWLFLHKPTGYWNIAVLEWTAEMAIPKTHWQMFR